MVASAVFVTDLSGKAIISRNYRGDIPLTKAIDRFAKYLVEVDDETMKPVFHVDVNGDVMDPADVGSTGPGGHTYVYVQVSQKVIVGRWWCYNTFLNIDDNVRETWEVEMRSE